MAADIDKLTEAEHIELDNRIVERSRMLDQMRSHVEVLEFRIGERVAFQPEGHPVVVGVASPSGKPGTRTLGVTHRGKTWR
jgi:hypothetical protein